MCSCVRNLLSKSFLRWVIASCVNNFEIALIVLCICLVFHKYVISCCYQEEFEDTKGAIRIRKSKDRQHNDQQKTDKRTNSDVLNIHIKLKIKISNVLSIKDITMNRHLLLSWRCLFLQCFNNAQMVICIPSMIGTKIDLDHEW